MTRGRQITTHYQSKNPFKNDAIHATWMHAGDTSAVWATRLRGSTDPAYVAPDAIEWLLLENERCGGRPVRRREAGEGQTPPACEHRRRPETVERCTTSTINTRQFVSDTADYYFYE